MENKKNESNKSDPKLIKESYNYMSALNKVTPKPTENSGNGSSGNSNESNNR